MTPPIHWHRCTCDEGCIVRSQEGNGASYLLWLAWSAQRMRLFGVLQELTDRQTTGFIINAQSTMMVTIIRVNQELKTAKLHC